VHTPRRRAQRLRVVKVAGDQVRAERLEVLGRLFARVTDEGAHLPAVVEQPAGNGAALAASGARDQDCFLVRHCEVLS
jgi:hypothetical protein